jgi:hypothetical protein
MEIPVSDDVKVVPDDSTLHKALSLTTASPEEAAKNIDRSRLFEISPDSYNGLKPELERDADAFERMPSSVAPETKKFLTQSEQHAALGKDDIKPMNWFEKRATYLKNKLVDIPSINNQIIELSNKEVTEGKLSDGEKELLGELNASFAEINKSAEEIPGISDFEKGTSMVLEGVEDFGRSYWDNKAILATTTATGAGLGALSASFIPVPGLSTAAGGVAGAIEGFTTGSTIVGFVDGYSRMRGMMNNELSQLKNEKGEPLNMPIEKRARISQGVALIAGIGQGFAGRIIAKNNPFMQQFVSPKLAAKLLQKSPEVLAKMHILGGVAESALTMGGSAALTTLTKIVGENFAKMDDSEASFTNALEQSMNSDTFKEMAKSAGVGAATGVAISGTMGVAGYKGLTKRMADAQRREQFRQYRQKQDAWMYEQNGTPEQQQKFIETKNVNQKRAEVLETQNTMLELAKDIKDTKVQKHAPQEMKAFTQKVFSALGMGENFWFTMESIKDFSEKNPEASAAVRKVIDPKGEMTKMVSELNTPVAIPGSDLIHIITEFPDIADHMRLTPDGESPHEARTNAKAFTERLTGAAAKREEILSSLGVDQPMTPEIEAQLKELATQAHDPNVYNDQNHYIESQSFKEMDGIMTKEEAETWNTTHLGARLAVAESLKAEVDDHFQGIENKIFRDVNAKDIAHDIKRLDSEFKVIDRFKDKTTTAQTVEHKDRGFSAVAIDPKSLPEDLKEIFMKNPTHMAQLTKRKVFVEGGLDLEESAALNGVEDGAELLRILAMTPSKGEVTKVREQRKIELRNRIHQTINPARQISRDDAFSNLTKIHIKEMEHMRTKEWPTTKRGIIKIASPLPTIESLNTKAKETLAKMPIKDINPNVYKQGESVSQRTALKNFLNAEFEQAFDNKQKAAQNNEMRKEALNALDKVAKYEKFWKKVNKPTIQQELKDAGYDKVMNDFLEVYKLDGAVKGQAEKNAFNNWIKKQVNEGNYTPVVPERLDNVQESYKDLTLEQYQAITEMGQFLVHKAKLKNKLLRNAEARAELKTAEMIAADIERHTSAHVDFDPKKAKTKKSKNLSVIPRFQQGVQTSLSLVSSVKSIVSELDSYQMGGYFHEIIGQPIKEARTAKRQEMLEIETHDKAIIEKIYGLEKFKKMFNEYIDVPEFADINELGLGNEKGSIRKVDLLVLQAYMGDPEGRKAMENFVSGEDTGSRRLTVEDVQTVLDRELDHTDAIFVQNFLVDRFKRFEKRSFDLHKKTTGIEPDMIKGVSVTHKGKVLPGGYYPVKRQMMTDESKITKMLESLHEAGSNALGATESHFFAKMRSAEMTQQGRLKERTGSDRPLDVTFENVFDFTEEAVHDLHFRELGIDTLKILKNPVNIKNIKSVIGPIKFTTLINGVKDIVSKTTEREATLFSEEANFIDSGIQKIHSLHAVMTIGMNVSSAAIQADSLTNLMTRVGPKAGLYLIKHAKNITANLHNFPEMVKLAEEINPDIRFEKDNIDNAVVKDSYDFIPASNAFFEKYKTGSAQKIASIRELQQKAIDASFVLVRDADRFNKVLTTLAISEMFLNGDVEGYPLEKLNTMTDNEKAKAMQSVVQQAIDLSLTASAPEDKTPMEKIKVANLLTRYWTDRRSRLNAAIAQIDKAKGQAKKGNYGKAAAQLLTLALASGISAAYVKMVRKGIDSVLPKLKDKDDVIEFAKSTAYNFLYSPIDQTLDTVPLIDGIKYQTELNVKSDYRNVSVPFFGVASDFASGVVALKDLLAMGNKASLSKLSDDQRKFLLRDFGYIIGGAPTNAMTKAIGVLNSKQVKKGSEHIREEIKELHQEIEKFIGINKDNPKAEVFINDLKEYKKTLPHDEADPVKSIIPENTKKFISSGSAWDSHDSVTGAAGTYQFTEERWNEIAATNPDLGLTENGRVAKDQSQQEKAIQWEIEDNTRSLMAYEIPVTAENLAGAHKFGFDNYISIWSAKDNVKLTKLLGDEAKKPVFNDLKTVKDAKESLKSKGRNPASLPDGWGRSVVNGVEVLTPPSDYKEGDPKPKGLTDEEVQNTLEEIKSDRVGIEEDLKAPAEKDPIEGKPDYGISDEEMADIDAWNFKHRKKK